MWMRSRGVSRRIGQRERLDAFQRLLWGDWGAHVDVTARPDGSPVMTALTMPALRTSTNRLVNRAACSSLEASVARHRVLYARAHQ